MRRPGGRDDASCGALVFNELPSIQFSNSSRQFTPSLPGLTRQSIFFENGLAKIDGCPGHLARRRASRFCPGMTSVDISTPYTRSFSRRDAPEAWIYFPPEEGVGNAGCPLHPRSRVHLVVVERTRVTTSTPESPDVPARNGFTTYFVLSPVTGLFCHRHQRICFCLSPVGPT